MRLLQPYGALTSRLVAKEIWVDQTWACWQGRIHTKRAHVLVHPYHPLMLPPLSDNQGWTGVLTPPFPSLDIELEVLPPFPLSTNFPPMVPLPAAFPW